VLTPPATPATPDLQASHRRKTPAGSPARFYKTEHERRLLIHRLPSRPRHPPRAPRHLATIAAGQLLMGWQT